MAAANPEGEQIAAQAMCPPYCPVPLPGQPSAPPAGTPGPSDTPFPVQPAAPQRCTLELDVSPVYRLIGGRGLVGNAAVFCPRPLNVRLAALAISVNPDLPPPLETFLGAARCSFALVYALAPFFLPVVSGDVVDVGMGAAIYDPYTGNQIDLLLERRGPFVFP